ncbi:hypothetical protein HK098_002152 [Nowakowskiella sp. JEL0407]|nr:hypothetical protein HK098_002152 [Nowakowskiella sp. JEL0407]
MALVIIPFNDVILNYVNSAFNIAHSRAASTIIPQNIIDRVIYFLTTGQIINTATETIVPMLISYGLVKVSNISHTPPESSENIGGSVADKNFVARVLKESALPEYDVYSDYAEMVTQFGFLVLFSVVWPLAPFACLLNNFIELRSDVVKFCVNSRRPVPSRSDGIGMWNQSLFFISWISALVSPTISIIYSTYDAQIPFSKQSVSKFGQICFDVIVVEHVWLGLYFIVRHFANELVDSAKTFLHTRSVNDKAMESRTENLSARKKEKLHVFETKRDLLLVIGADILENGNDNEANLASSECVCLSPECHGECRKRVADVVAMVELKSKVE